ncbi:MAG TPA: hypothetical protein VF006_25445 [Longimicrobium sp.]
MLHITGGHYVQHIHFPVPLVRDLDEFDAEAPREGAPPSDAAREDTAEADAPADAAR